MTTNNRWHDYVVAKAQEAQRASRPLATASTDVKDAALAAMAQALADRTSELLEANAQDLAGAEEKGLTKAMIDRAGAWCLRDHHGHGDRDGGHGTGAGPDRQSDGRRRSAANVYGDGDGRQRWRRADIQPGSRCAGGRQHRSGDGRVHVDTGRDAGRKRLYDHGAGN